MLGNITHHTPWTHLAVSTLSEGASAATRQLLSTPDTPEKLESQARTYLAMGLTFAGAGAALIGWQIYRCCKARANREAAANAAQQNPPQGAAGVMPAAAPQPPAAMV